jgi:hypothetical protein
MDAVLAVLLDSLEETTESSDPTDARKASGGRTSKGSQRGPLRPVTNTQDSEPSLATQVGCCIFCVVTAVMRDEDLTLFCVGSQ